MEQCRILPKRAPLTQYGSETFSSVSYSTADGIQTSLDRSGFNQSISQSKNPTRTIITLIIVAQCQAKMHEVN